MRLPFLTPPAERISADGKVDLVHAGGSLGRLRPRVWLLARDLCTFQLFETRNLPRNRRRQAAMLFARTASPYVVGGMVVVPAGADYGVWWWDLERVSALFPRGLSSGAVVRPETLAQPLAESWRIVRLAKGYEGQLWRAGRLLASSWRPQPFDGPAWMAFTRLQRDGFDAPAAPPTPVMLPIAPDSEAFAFSGLDLSPRQMAVGFAGMAAFFTLLTSLFFLGQGLRLADDRRDVELEAATLRSGLPTASNTQGLDTDRRRLAAYAEIERRTNPLTASGAALGIVALYNVDPISLETDAESLTIKVPYTALKSINELVGEFANSGYFYDVEPRTDATGQTLSIAMKVRSGAEPLGSPG